MLSVTEMSCTPAISCSGWVPSENLRNQSWLGIARVYRASSFKETTSMEEAMDALVLAARILFVMVGPNPLSWTLLR